MRNKLTLMLLFIGIFFCSLHLFAEDRGYSERELEEIRNLPDKDLKRMKNTWDKEERKRSQEMVEPAQRMRQAEGELNRAKKGQYTVKDLVNPTAAPENRVSSAQHKYDAAKKNWEKARDKHDDAVYAEGVAGIYLKEREDASKKNR